MRKIGAYAAIGVLAAVIFSPPPIAAFGLRLGPFSFGLPSSFGLRHRIARHPNLPAGTVLYNSAEFGPASAQSSALLNPESALQAIFNDIFSPTSSLPWPFDYYSIFQAAFAKDPANQDRRPCQQVVRGTAIIERIERDIRPTAPQRLLLQSWTARSARRRASWQSYVRKKFPRNRSHVCSSWERKSMS